MTPLWSADAFQYGSTDNSVCPLVDNVGIPQAEPSAPLTFPAALRPHFTFLPTYIVVFTWHVPYPLAPILTGAQATSFRHRRAVRIPNRLGGMGHQAVNPRPFFGKATPVAMRFVHVYRKCRQLKVALLSLAGLGSYKTEPHFIRPRNMTPL